MTYSLQNRRYIGNKYKLLSFIEQVLYEENIKYNSVVDLFAGTGVVSDFFMSHNKKVVINDNLYSNYVFYNAWLSGGEYSRNKIEELIDYYNRSNGFLRENYFSNTFANTYYSYSDALRIGSIREHIEGIKSSLTKREYYIVLSSLLYTADKIANTVGHFEAFLAKPPKEKGVVLENLNIKKYNIDPDIYQEDANILVRNIKSDLLYLDPPYNARQYVNFYHVLENLAEWKKLPVYGKTLKFICDEKKSQYSQSKATLALSDLVNNTNTKYILLSYNNTYSAKSGASINKIKSDDIISILTSVGYVKKFSVKYPSFNSGKTYLPNHEELLYLCTLF